MNTQTSLGVVFALQTLRVRQDLARMGSAVLQRQATPKRYQPITFAGVHSARRYAEPSTLGHGRYPR